MTTTLRVRGSPSFTALVLALAILGACGQQSTESLISSAKEAMSKGDTATAVIQLRNAIDGSPESGEARFLFGKALLNGGNPRAAALELRKARGLQFDDELVVPVLARALLAEQQYAEVIEQLASVPLRMAESQADLRTSVAVALAEQGAAAKAEDVLREALAAKSDYARAKVLEVRFAAQRGEAKQVAELLPKLIEHYPKESEAWLVKADIENFALRNPDAAINAYRMAIVFDKKNINAHAGALSILMGRADTAAVERQLEDLRNVAPKHPQTIFFSVQLALRKGDLDDARQELQNLLAVAGDNADVLVLAGAVESERSNYLVAESHLRRAIQQRGDQALARQLLAQSYLRMGLPQKAQEVLGPLLERDPDSATLTFAAHARLLEGDAKGAEEFYKRALKRKPTDVTSKSMLALFDIRRGSGQAGFNVLESLSLSDRGLTADLTLISAHLARRDFAAAFRAIDQLEKKTSDKAFGRYLFGWTQQLQGSKERARQAYEQALKIDGAYMPALAALAKLDIAEGKPESARKRFESVVKADEKNVQALVALAELVDRYGPDRDDAVAYLESAIAAAPSRSEPYLRLVANHLQAGRVAQALIIAQKGVAALPNDAELLDAQGRSQLAASENQQALTTFSTLVGLLPDSAAAHARRADAYLALKDTKGAFQSLKRALQLSADFLPAQEKLVSIEASAGRHREAIAIARDVQRQRPKEGIGYALEADIESARGKTDAAIAMNNKALNVSPRTEYAVRLHLALLAARKIADAERLGLEWVRNHPRDALFLQHLGNTATGAGDYALAETKYRAALKLNPNNPTLLTSMARVLLLQQKAGASEFALKAMERRPEDAEIKQTAALALSSDGHSDRAIELQQSVVNTYPKEPQPRLNLARIYAKAGLKSEAIDELEVLEQLGANYAKQKDVAQMLKALRGG